MFPYKLCILSSEVEIMIDSKHFLRLTKNKVLPLKPGENGQYWFKKSLTCYEVRRAESIFGSNSWQDASIEMIFYLQTVAGEEIYRTTKTEAIELVKWSKS